MRFRPEHVLRKVEIGRWSSDTTGDGDAPETRIEFANGIATWKRANVGRPSRARLAGLMH
jgi:hypothetical protein